jgi:hypothetical protein
VDSRGYETRWNGNRRVKQHILIAEKAYGGPLPSGVLVHHLDGTKSNHNGNLAILPDQAYHLLIHQRMNAKLVCGNPGWRKCVYCKKYDDPEIMRLNKSNNTYYHKLCAVSYLRDRSGYVFSRSS